MVAVPPKPRQRRARGATIAPASKRGVRVDANRKKQQVARAAVELVKPILRPDTIIGVGTGSTANCFIEALIPHASRFKAAVASSKATAERLSAGGIALMEAADADTLAVYVDGADEADPNFCLIKGAGGALTREKIVAAIAERFVCIVDDSKCVGSLGACPLPIEVIPMAVGHVTRMCAALGGKAMLREGFVTDNGNLILDVSGLDLSAPGAMESELNDIAGVVSNGLFALRPADVLMTAEDEGVTTQVR